MRDETMELFAPDLASDPFGASLPAGRRRQIIFRSGQARLADCLATHHLMARRISSRATKGGVRRERRLPSAKGDDTPRTIADVYDAAVVDAEANARKRKGARRVEAFEASGSDSESSSEEGKDRYKGVKLEYDGNDDEDIDSDDAFASGDDEAFDGWAFRASKSGGSKGNKGGSQGNGKGRQATQDFGNKRKRAQEESSEDEGDLTDYDEGDMMDIDALFDHTGESDAVESDDSDNDNDNANDNNNNNNDDDDASEGDDAVDEFARQVDEMASKNKTQEERPSKRRKEEPLAPGVEGSTAVSLQDLLAGVEGNAALAGVRKNAQNLDKLTSHTSSGGSAAAKGTGTLAAPLQTTHQERLDREAAYEVAKADALGWQTTTNRIRDAETLMFPLQSRPVPSASVASLVAPRKEDKPTGSEAELDALLSAAGVGEEAQGEKEKLALAKLDPEELKRRYAELRRMRYLMSKTEEKAKRAAKIKSKAFRRQQRKDKEKLAEQNSELAELARLEAAARRADGFTVVDPDAVDHEAGSDDDRLKAERDRALERATLKHKNTGKWAKQQLRRRDLDEGTRRALADQLQRAAELRAKVAGGAASSDEESFDDNDEDAEGPGNHHAFDELLSAERSLAAEAEATNGQAATGPGNKSGIMDMAFMQNARARRVQAAQEDLQAARKQLEKDGSDDSDLDQEEDPNVLRLSKNGGRAMYGAAQSGQTAAPVSKEPADTTPAIVAAPSAKQDERKNGKSQRDSTGADPVDKAVAEALRTQSSKTDLSKHKGKSSWLSAAPQGDEDADDDGWFAPLESKAAKAGKPSKKKGQRGQEPGIRLDAQAQAALLGDSDEGSDSDSGAGSEDEDEGQRGQQAAILAEAFAGEDVAADFETEKAAEVAAATAVKGSGWDDEAPGWGEWGGKGVKASAASVKRKEDKRRAREEAAAARAAARKDAKLPHVAIDDAADARSAAKYTLKDLPFPYTNKAQYDMARNTNLGREWNTQSQTMRLNMPRVQTRMGQVIRPLQRHF